jgi:hypothetical protein
MNDFSVFSVRSVAIHPYENRCNCPLIEAERALLRIYFGNCSAFIPGTSFNAFR